MMQLTLLKSKLHRACVTEVNIDYEGSIEIDEDLLDAAGILIYEQVHVFNLNNGNRFVTYAIPGKRGGRGIMVNGAAAHLAAVNDRIIIVAYAIMEEKKARQSRPRVIVLDAHNQIINRKIT